MIISYGEAGLDLTWQAPFAAETECSRCHKRARVAFVAYEEEGQQEYVSHLHQLEGVGGPFWPHDVIAVAVYFCTDLDCCHVTAVFNQA